jgi:hypothetical protein
MSLVEPGTRHSILVKFGLETGLDINQILFKIQHALRLDLFVNRFTPLMRLVYPYVAVLL